MSCAKFLSLYIKTMYYYHIDGFYNIFKNKCKTKVSRMYSYFISTSCYKHLITVYCLNVVWQRIEKKPPYFHSSLSVLIGLR